jgi:hypothetical protein
MQTVGKAGVYGNPAPAAQDFSQSSPIPDDAWIAKYTAQGQPPQMTIWGLGTLGDTLWPNTQRIRQSQQNLLQAWGNATNYQIDPDIDNAVVVNANNGSKDYTYAYTTINYPGAIDTAAWGINDISSGGFINGPGLVGQIVGTYTDTNAAYHGFLLDAQNGWTSIDYPGATSTMASGVNNSSQIVGSWTDSIGHGHGFLLGGSCPNFCSFDFPGGMNTSAGGTNDAGQIAGSYYDSSGALHGFLYYGTSFKSSANFHSISYPGAGFTVANGINGDGTIAGYYSVPTSGNTNGFAEYALPPTWTGTMSAFSYPGALYTYGSGIN